MRRKFAFFVCLMMLFGFSPGCQVLWDQKTKAVDVTNPTAVSAVPANSEENTALGHAQELVDAIKEEDADRLMQLLNQSDRYQLDIEGTNKVIEGFKVNFDLNTLSVQIHKGLSMHPERGQYEFVLTDKNHKSHNQENSLVIQYEDGGIVFYHNPYSQYFAYAEKMVLRYEDLIEQGNTTELAEFLNADDIDVPESVADAIIRNYKEFRGRGKMSVHYTNGFNFVLKNSSGKEHPVKVIYGDGLMSIKDDFMPDF